MKVFILTGYEGTFLGVCATLEEALDFARADSFVPEGHVVGTRPWAQGDNLHVTVDGEDTGWYDIRPTEVGK